MYLENIFVGSEDIRRQLPAESALFDSVHVGFMRMMAQLEATGNALAACTTPGVLDTFQVNSQ
jgi:dynein heavy chain